MREVCTVPDLGTLVTVHRQDLALWVEMAYNLKGSQKVRPVPVRGVKMTLLESRPGPADVTYGLSDADQHYYEAEDAVTRHLPKEHRSVVRWVEVDGRRLVLVGDRLLSIVPNPTYDPVGVPGSLEVYFRAQNHEGKEIRDIIEMAPIPPAARDRVARVAKLDEQGVDLAWVLPSLGLGLDEMLAKDVDALYAVFHSYNQWLDEDWGYNRDGRILTGPLMSLIDPVKAEEELKLVIKKGARFVTFRPAPVQAPDRYRSLADPIYDRFWHTAADAGVTIAFHGADSGYGIYLERWGESLKYTGMKMSTLSEVMGVHIERPVFDLVASLICHGLFDRVPNLQIATVELGAGWVPELVKRFKRSYGKTPQLYGRDPLETLRSHVSVAPFYEDDITILRDLIGADRILLGSDWPHPEGLGAPRDWLGDFEGLTVDERRLALRDNLRSLCGFSL